MRDPNSKQPSSEEDNTWQELMGPDLLMKTLSKKSNTDENDESQAVKPADAVRIDFVARYAPDQTIEDGPICQDVEDWLIVIGEKDVLPALEMGVRFMNVGETAMVWSHSKFAHGPGHRQHGDYTLPPNSNVLYTITVRAIINPSNTVIDDIAVALSKKNIGNDIFANEWNPYGILRAKQQYKRGGELMEHMLQSGTLQNSDESFTAKAREIMLDCYNNLSAVHLRNKEYKLAKEAAVKVLEQDPDNFKALIRAAKAALLDPASEFDEVEAALEAAAARSEHANETDLKKLKEEFLRRKKAYKKKSKAMFSNKKKFESSIQTISEEVSEEMEENKNDESVEELEEIKENIVSQTSNLSETTDTLSDTNITYSWMDWRKWDWKNKVLPYAFQLILPFIMYWYYTVLKKQHDEKMTSAIQALLQSQQVNDNEFEGILSLPIQENDEL